MSSAHPDLVQVSVWPRSERELAKISLAVRAVEQQSPALNVCFVPETGNAVIRGQDDSTLFAALALLDRTYINVGPLQAVYRLSITNPVEVDYTHKKRVGPAGEFARVRLHVSPKEAGSGFEFGSSIVGSSVPDEYIPGVVKGALSATQSDDLMDVPVVTDIKVLLVDGAFHDLDSSTLTFEIASRAALLDALRTATLVLFEPIMKVDIAAPEEHAGLIVEDLKARNGRVKDRQSRGGDVLVDATVPLANMLGYADVLEVFALGRAKHTLKFDHYAQISVEQPDPPLRPAAAIRLAFPRL
jgi:elongation factor G